MLALTQPACSYSYVPKPACAWPAPIFKCPHLPSPVDACSYLPSPVHACTCPCLLISVSPVHTHTCPCLLIPALTCLCSHLSTLACICPHLPMLMPAPPCPHMFMPTPALTCLYLSMPTPVKAPPPPMSFRIPSCFPATLGLLFLLFQRLLSPSLSWLPASYPRASFGDDSPMCWREEPVLE